MFEISTQISFESHNDDDYGQTFLFYFFSVSFVCSVCCSLILMLLVNRKKIHIKHQLRKNETKQPLSS